MSFSSWYSFLYQLLRARDQVHLELDIRLICWEDGPKDWCTCLAYLDSMFSITWSSSKYHLYPFVAGLFHLVPCLQCVHSQCSMCWIPFFLKGKMIFRVRAVLSLLLEGSSKDESFPSFPNSCSPCILTSIQFLDSTASDPAFPFYHLFLVLSCETTKRWSISHPQDIYGLSRGDALAPPFFYPLS